jgi:hypothetical protein
VFSRSDAIERHKKRTNCAICNGGVVADEREDVVEDQGKLSAAFASVVEGVQGVQVIDLEGIVEGAR